MLDNSVLRVKTRDPESNRLIVTTVAAPTELNLRDIVILSEIDLPPIARLIVLTVPTVVATTLDCLS